MDTSQIAADFDRHRALPEVSVEEYVRRRSVELGEWVMARERVYLDKCFWIALRDVRLMRTDDPSSKVLLQGLVRAVQEGRRICPISDALFLELLKQTDLHTRAATAELIDELSCGVTLIPHPTRIATEIAHFLYANTGHSVYALETLVWSKLANVLGVHHPMAKAFPAEDQVLIQKAFFDHMWRFSLAEMMQVIDERKIPDCWYPALADRLNQGKAAHADEITNFAQVYRDEVYGILDVAAPIALDVLGKMASDQGRYPAAPTQDERATAIREILGILRAAIEKPHVKHALRSLHLDACLHAALRWNKTQRFDANDLYDFQHAVAALGYCDFFLTDGPMHTLLTQKHLAFRHESLCRVGSSIEEAAVWLQ
ncbi:MAG: hypothetical protein JNK03_09580 [Nitrospira sp.]|jgi:hypothetical protein|nr:hypothetical protein [Nitrospira sp.]